MHCIFNKLVTSPNKIANLIASSDFPRSAVVLHIGQTVGNGTMLYFLQVLDESCFQSFIAVVTV